MGPPQQGVGGRPCLSPDATLAPEAHGTPLGVLGYYQDLLGFAGILLGFTGILLGYY